MNVAWGEFDSSGRLCIVDGILVSELLGRCTEIES
jgi:hypothetical protein